MTKKLFPILWGANALLLLIVVVAPNIEELYYALSLISLLSMFLAPLLLILFQAWSHVNREIIETKKSNLIFCPNLGCSLLMALITLNTIRSIEKAARIELVVIMLTFIAAQLALGYVVYQCEKIERRKYIWSQVATYVLLLLFIFCSMVMTFDWGLI